MDRLENNQRDGLKLAVDGAKTNNYLGDPTVVDQLVRDFMSVVFSTRAQYHQDGDDAGAEHRIADMCRRYGEIFMGDSKAHVAMPWNAPHRLGAYLRATVEDANDYGSPGEAYFNFLAVQALNAAIALEQEAMSEVEVQSGLSDVVADAVDVLLGRKPGAIHE